MTHQQQTTAPEFLTITDVCARYRGSRMWVYRRQLDSGFPAPFRFGHKRNYTRRWRLSDLLQWEDQQRSEATIIIAKATSFQFAASPRGRSRVQLQEVSVMEPQALLSAGQAAKRLGLGKTELLALVIEAFNNNLPAGYVAGKAVRHG